MPDINEQILSEVKELKSWLYNANGHEGDIPEIKAALKNHGKRIRVIEIVIAGLLATGGGAVGLTKLIGG